MKLYPSNGGALHPVLDDVRVIYSRTPVGGMPSRTLDGWFRHVQKKFIHHNGGYVGTSALAFRRDDGVAVTFLVNSELFPAGGDSWQQGSRTILNVYDASYLLAVIDAVPAASWPSGDLFDLAGY